MDKLNERRIVFFRVFSWYVLENIRWVSIDATFTKSCLIMPVYLTVSICLSVTAEEPLLAFLWNVILENFTKFWTIIPILVEIRQ